MKKIIAMLFVLLYIQIQAQQTQETTSDDLTKEIDKRLEQLDKSSITSHILIDRVASVTGIQMFNQGIRKDTSNFVHFKQAWSELNRASYIQKKNYLTLTNKF